MQYDPGDNVIFILDGMLRIGVVWDNPYTRASNNTYRVFNDKVLKIYNVSLKEQMVSVEEHVILGMAPTHIDNMFDLKKYIETHLTLFPTSLKYELLPSLLLSDILTLPRYEVDSTV